VRTSDLTPLTEKTNAYVFIENTERRCRNIYKYFIFEPLKKSTCTRGMDY
jgi:hypothetical protein